MENIGWFSEFLTTYGVQKEYVFVTVDLYEKQNVPQVRTDLFAIRKNGSIITKMWINDCKYMKHISWTADKRTNRRKIIAVSTQLKQLPKESLKKIQAWTGFEPMTSAMPVQCCTNWAIKPTGSWSYCEFVIHLWSNRRKILAVRTQFN